MNMASPRAGPRGPQNRSSFVHFSECIASDPTSSGVGSSQIGTRFADFLNGEPIAGLTSALTPCWREDHLDAAGWQRRALQVEVQLGDGDEYARPSASAMLLAPVTGSAAQTCQRHGQSRAIKRPVAGAGGSPVTARALGLPGWQNQSRRCHPGRPRPAAYRTVILPPARSPDGPCPRTSA
jgi:hypothetical protein